MERPKYKLYYKKDIHGIKDFLSYKSICVLEDKCDLIRYDTLMQSQLRVNLSKIGDQKVAWLYINRLAKDNRIGTSRGAIQFWRRLWGEYFLKIRASMHYLEGEHDFENFKYTASPCTEFFNTKDTDFKKEYQEVRQLYDVEKRYKKFREPAPEPAPEPTPEPKEPAPEPKEPAREPTKESANIRPRLQTNPLKPKVSERGRGGLIICKQYPKCTYTICKYLHEDDTQEMFEKKWKYHYLDDKELFTGKKSNWELCKKYPNCIYGEKCYFFHEDDTHKVRQKKKAEIYNYWRLKRIINKNSQQKVESSKVKTD